MLYRGDTILCHTMHFTDSQLSPVIVLLRENIVIVFEYKGLDVYRVNMKRRNLLKHTRKLQNKSNQLELLGSV